MLRFETRASLSSVLSFPRYRLPSDRVTEFLETFALLSLLMLRASLSCPTVLQICDFSVAVLSGPFYFCGAEALA